MPAIHITAIPTDYALKCRNWFWTFAGILLLCSAVQIIFFLNIIPGFMMVVISTVGFYTIRDRSVDMNCLMSWGMLCLVNGIFDTVFLVDRAIKMPRPLFSMKENFLYNAIHLVVTTGPVCEILIAYMVYRVYKEATEYDRTFPRGDGEPRSDAATGYGTNNSLRAPSARESAGSTSGRQPASNPFTPFAGKGNTLGATDSN